MRFGTTIAPLLRWLAAQLLYSELEAAKLASSRADELTMSDKVRKLVILAHFLVFPYCLFVKGNILDGKNGLYCAHQRTLAETLLSSPLPNMSSPDA